MALITSTDGQFDQEDPKAGTRAHALTVLESVFNHPARLKPKQDLKNIVGVTTE